MSTCEKQSIPMPDAPQLHGVLRDEDNAQPEQLPDAPDVRGRSKRPAAAKAAPALRNFLDDTVGSTDGRKRRGMRARGRGVFCGRDVVAGIPISGAEELESGGHIGISSELPQAPIEDSSAECGSGSNLESVARDNVNTGDAMPHTAQQPLSIDPCLQQRARVYTTSSNFQNNSRGIQNLDCTAIHACQRSTPRTRSMDRRGCAVNSTTQFDGQQAGFSSEVQGSGFVIAPNWRSVNASEGRGSLRPQIFEGQAPQDPLTYLDGLWTSQAECSNNVISSHEYCMPSVIGSEEFEGPNGDREDGVEAINPPVTPSGEFPMYCRLHVKLNCMEWGGECLPNPSPSAVGVLLHAIKDVEGVVKEYVVDFGDYLGVQRVEPCDCKRVPVGTSITKLRPWEPLPDPPVVQNVDDGGGRGRGRGRGRSRGQGRNGRGANLRDGQMPNNIPGIVETPTDEALQVENGHGRGRGRCPRGRGRRGGRSTAMAPTTILDPIHPEDLDDESSYTAKSSDESSSDGSLDSSMEPNWELDDLAALGIPAVGPMPQTESFDSKYAERNWHAKSWRMKSREAFCGPTPGLKNIPDGVERPIHFFELLWNDAVWTKMLIESDAYARWVNPNTGKQKGGQGGGKPMTRVEHRRFIGICCLMGVKEQPEIRDYWKKKSSPLHCPEVSACMSRDRFEHVLRCLHLTSNATYVRNKSDPLFDPIGKTRWLLETLAENSRHYLNPGAYVCVDECMVAYNGRYCGFKQYMPAKPIKHGIKLWALCCSATKYVLKLEVYAGASAEEPREQGELASGSGYSVVFRLAAGLDHQFYTVACDNYFTSPALFEALYERGIYAVGTVRGYRKGYPNSLRMGDSEPRGTLHIRMHRDLLMSAVYWSDCSGVLFLSTGVDPYSKNCFVTRHVRAREDITLPCSPQQLAYSKNMRGVDVQDQLRCSYMVGIPTKKWWHRLYFFCLDTALTNAFILYKLWCVQHDLTPMTHKDFQLNVAVALMESEGQEHSPVPTRIHRRQPHVPERIAGRMKCYECGRRTQYICPRHQNVPLHMGTCWIVYHDLHE